jgi:hypothetical protein
MLGASAGFCFNTFCSVVAATARRVKLCLTGLGV